MCKRTVCFIVFLIIIAYLAGGCQTDLHGGMSIKVFHKGENNGDVWKSRAAGPTYTGGHGSVFSWGNVGN